MLLATVPALLMFVALASLLYVTGKQDVRDKVAASGHLLARTLAETSQYDVFSGNTGALEHALQRMLKADESIASIQILDPVRRVMVSMGKESRDPTLTFEEPIVDDVPDIDLYQGEAPHVSHQGGGTTQFKAAHRIGFVRVTMSSRPLLAGQRHRLYWSGLAMALVFGLVTGIGISLAQVIRGPLVEVMSVLRGIRQGRLDANFASRPHGEMGELQATIEEMVKGLSKKRHELEDEVAIRTDQLQVAMTRATEVDRERRRLLAHSADLVEEERRRISSELHDQFNSSLLSVKMRAAALFARGGPPLRQEQVESIATAITSAIDQLYRDARQMVKRLRPEVLDTLGLRGAIVELVRTFNEASQACTLSLRIDDAMPRLTERVSIVVYRAVQEALNNIVKHSRATQGEVSMRYDDRSGMIHIKVSDNGIGFHSSTRPAGFGLLGLRERLDGIGGTLRVLSANGRGTHLIIDFPVEPDPQEV